MNINNPINQSAAYFFDPNIFHAPQPTDNPGAKRSLTRELYWNYILPKTHGTETPVFIDSDFSNKSISQTKDDYFEILKFQDKYNKSSNQMYQDWMEGASYGVEESEWLNAYLRVWDKVKIDDLKTT